MYSSHAPNIYSVHTGLALPYLSASSCMFDAVKHGPKFCQPLSVHCSHTLHVLLQHKLQVKTSTTHIFLIVFTPAESCNWQTFYLGGHDELVVDDVVGSVAHAKEGAGGMEVTWHARPHVDVFTNALGANTDINNTLNVQLRLCGEENVKCVCLSLHLWWHFKARSKQVIWVNLLLHLAQTAGK